MRMHTLLSHIFTYITYNCQIHISTSLSIPLGTWLSVWQPMNEIACSLETQIKFKWYQATAVLKCCSFGICLGWQKKPSANQNNGLVEGKTSGWYPGFYMFSPLKKQGSKNQGTSWKHLVATGRIAQPMDIAGWKLLNPPGPLSWRALGRYYTWPTAKGTKKYNSDVPRVSSSWYFVVHEDECFAQMNHRVQDQMQGI